ncbi:MAG: penicillin-insensitive murein endopeptidase [Pyrinomonadaceae bacterium]
MAILRLTGSVGSGSSKKGIPHNEISDVIKVRDRLIELGYDWIGGITDGKNKDFIRVIKLFQTIYKGHSKFDTGDGRVDLHGTTHKWLAAENAPGWVHMEGKSGIGWEVAKFDHGNAWTTTWMLFAIHMAGIYYRGLDVLSADVSDAPPMWVRDCSPHKGGKATGHASHQTGLDVDMRLPLLPPDTLKWDQLKAGDYDKRFHRQAALLQVTAIKKMMNTRFIFFNDPEFIKKRLSTHEKNHGEHYHIRIKPPERIEGTYM